MKKKILYLIAGGLLLSSGSVFAKGGCDVNVQKMNMNATLQEQAKKMTENADLQEAFLKPGGKAADGSDPFALDALNSCMESWPSAGFNFQIPTVDSVIKDVAEAAVDKACDFARDKVSSAVSGLSGGFSVPSTIPGVPSIGISGGVGSGTSLKDIANGKWGSAISGNSISNAGTSITNAGNSITNTGNSIVEGWNQIEGLFK